MYNPTEAKEIALRFLELIGQDLSRSNIARTIKLVKSLQERKYTSEEIWYAVEYAYAKTPTLYSFGYVASLIDDALRNRPTVYQKEAVQIEPIKVTAESEVVKEDDTSERNRRKAEKHGIQSGKREKSYLDMLEE